MGSPPGAAYYVFLSVGCRKSKSWEPLRYVKESVSEILGRLKSDILPAAPQPWQ